MNDRRRTAPHDELSRTALGPCWSVGLLCALLSGCDLPGKPPPGDEFKRPDKVLDFKVLFTKNCAGCHGADGKAGPAPPLNDAPLRSLIPEAEVKRVIREGRQGTPMPAFAREKGGSLTPEQVEVLAKGVLTHWGKPAEPKTGSPKYLASKNGDAASGKRVFAQACAGCHGKDGTGGSAGAINDPTFLALVSDQALRRIIITGRHDLGTTMPAWDESTGRPSDYRPLTNQDVTDLGALLASWREKR